MVKEYLYIQEESNENPLFRKILIALLLVALISGVVAGTLISLRSVNMEQKQADFEAALTQRDYDTAIMIYRQIKEKATDTRQSDRERERYIQALNAINGLADERIADIEVKIQSGFELEQNEIALIDGLSELAASRMITQIRDISRQYLVGETDRKRVDHAFEQLGSIDAIAQGVAQIPQELDEMGQIRSQVAQAVRSIEQQDFWTGYAAINDLLNTDGPGPFAREQLTVLLENCQSVMYAPLIDEATQLMEGGRYLSADAAFRKIQTVFPDDTDIQQAIEACAPYIPDQLVPYEGAVEFISVKPLINQPERAFDNDSYAAAAFDSMMTVTEFSRMIEALYENDYILVDAERLYNEKADRQEITLPPGKKPLVLVLEGLNYYVTRRETGNAWNLIFDEGGEVAAEYYDQSGNHVVSRTDEAIGILDVFVEKHPDFSLDGAKGTISLTGYECVFGYVTDADQLDDRNAALEAHDYAKLSLSESDLATNRSSAAQIIERLKMTGWQFASSTYGFIQARDHDLARIQNDTEKWLSQVGTLTGPVSILHYPNGAFINGSDERAAYLKEQGFKLFGGIGAFPYLYAGESYIYVDKVPVNGHTLKNSSQYQLERFFDASAIYDSDARNG